MPRGIYNRSKSKTAVKKKAAKKKAAKKNAKVDVIEMQPLNMEQNGKPRTTKEEIIDTLKRFHVHYVDKDGHIAIPTTQMLDQYAITELIENGVQAMHGRKDETGTYIALYY